MLHIIDEVTLKYEPTDYHAWISGAKEKWLKGEPEAHVLNQPRYHFGGVVPLPVERSRMTAPHS